MATDAALQHWHPLMPPRRLGRRPVECHLLDREIVLYRGADGRPHALDNRCPHRRMRLALGRVDGDRIVCPYHGWNFAPDGRGASPATPQLQVRTGCYDLAEHQGLLWLRSAGGHGALPALQFEGYRRIACLQHRLAAPLALLLDNMTELEHTATVHSVFGFELARLHEVTSSARMVDGGIDIDYAGPQRRLPWHLRGATGITRGDRFVQQARLRHDPLRVVYDLAWFDAASGRPRPLALKFVIHFDAVGAHAALQTTFVFARADSVRARLALRGFGFVLRRHIDQELRADIALVESLQLPADAPASGLSSRFDRPLLMRRRAEAAMHAASVQPVRMLQSLGD